MYRIRISIGFGMLVLVGSFTAIDYYTQTCYATAVILTILILSALWEFYNICTKRNYQPYIHFALGAAFIGLCCHIVANHQFGIGLAEILTGYEITIIFLLLLSTLLHTSEENVLENTFCTLFGLAYLYWPLSYLLKIRLLGNTPQHGLIFLLLTILTAKSMDIGGYLIGKAWGKHKIFPVVSPKKSWEGFLGGIILTIGSTFAIIYAFPNLTFLFQHWAWIIGYAILMSILSIWGDFSESLIKRRCQVKDSNHLIPEFGGILDLMDSLIFTAPVSYYYIQLLQVYSIQ